MCAAFAFCSRDNISWNCAMSLFLHELRSTAHCWTLFDISISVAGLLWNWQSRSMLLLALVVTHPHLVVVIHQPTEVCEIFLRAWMVHLIGNWQ